MKPIDLAIAAQRLYGRQISEERDERVRERVGPDATSRTVQALRGHVTRELLTEIKQEVDEANPPSKGETVVSIDPDDPQAVAEALGLPYVDGAGQNAWIAENADLPHDVGRYAALSFGFRIPQLLVISRNRTVQAEALSPSQLASELEAAIAPLIDRIALTETLATEKAQRRELVRQVEDVR